MRALLLLVFTLLSPSAFAQQQACPKGYNQETFDAHVREAEKQIIEFDLRLLKKATKTAMQFARCLPSQADPPLLARLGRTVSLLAFYKQDEDVAIQWALFSRAIAPDLPWPEEFSDDHPYRELVDAAAFTPIGRADGFQLQPPPRGAIYRNGTLLLTAETYSEIPLFIQVFDKHQVVVDAYWQHGAAFKNNWLVAGNGTYKVPKWAKEPKTPIIKTTTHPKPPKKGVPVAQIATSAGLALLAGGLYAGAAVNGKRLGEQTNEKDLRKVRTASNLMTLGALVSGGAAIGVGVTLLVGDTNGVAFKVRF